MMACIAWGLLAAQLAAHEPAPAPADHAPASTEAPGFRPIPARRKQGFPGAPFTTVRAFAFDLHVNGRPICPRPLAANGALCSTVHEPGVVLSAEQTQTLLAWARDRKTYGDGSACFLPHHGFVFYDANDVPIAELSVCFLCDMMEASPAIPGARRDGESGRRYGLDPKAGEKLRRLCTELGLPKCDARSPDAFAGP